MDYVFEVEIASKIYSCTWVPSNDLSGLDRKLVKGVRGFVFDEKGRVCLVKMRGDTSWTLPGGTLEEYDESFEDCFIREVDEEADVDLANIIPMGYLKAYPKGHPDKEMFDLRYVATVDAHKEQTVDPATNEINKRTFIDPKDFVEMTGWKPNGQWQLDAALKLFKERSL